MPTPYLMFNGRCEEALNFYAKALNAKIDMLMRFKDSPEPPQPGCTPADANKIMHASFSVNGSPAMASDGMDATAPKFEGFTLSVTARDEPEAARFFTALAEGGNIQMPLTKTFFAKSFGMLADRFGVSWMIIVPA
ncbi:MAG: VOC family protein [Pseudorhodoplanes sp.]